MNKEETIRKFDKLFNMTEADKLANKKEFIERAVLRAIETEIDAHKQALLDNEAETLKTMDAFVHGIDVATNLKRIIALKIKDQDIKEVLKFIEGFRDDLFKAA